jgi:hypothetical protein
MKKGVLSTIILGLTLLASSAFAQERTVTNGDVQLAGDLGTMMGGFNIISSTAAPGLLLERSCAPSRAYSRKSSAQSRNYLGQLKYTEASDISICYPARFTVHVQLFKHSNNVDYGIFAGFRVPDDGEPSNLPDTRI